MKTDIEIIGEWVCPNCGTLNTTKHCRNCCTGSIEVCPKCYDDNIKKQCLCGHVWGNYLKENK